MKYIAVESEDGGDGCAFLQPNERCGRTKVAKLGPTIRFCTTGHKNLIWLPEADAAVEIFGGAAAFGTLEVVDGQFKVNLYE